MERADAPRPIAVTVAYSPMAGVVEEVALTLPDGATLQQGLEASGLLQRHPQIVPGARTLGIWGCFRPPDTLLRDGDRIEVYRPLRVEPMEARRLRQRRQQAATCSPKR
jgi:putative ubiquitin-RnfH superfamily antitoxin RatB of RatAB toxin-antitoxin module